MIFCTLFDSNYLDKGLAMYRSLQRTAKAFRVYVLAMDQKCEKILLDYAYENMTVISLEEFVPAMGLTGVRETRPRGEFCWTCACHLIDYVLTHFGEPICTYVDADLLFYQDPQCLIDEMGDKTVQIVEHGFDHSIIDRKYQESNGRYCVQFNTFKNTPDALELLRWWEGQCVSSCDANADGKVFGDQKYLDGWEKRENVAVLKNPGGGVAPWNIAHYRRNGDENGVPRLVHKRDGKAFTMVFYHFHHIVYLKPRTVDIVAYNFNFGVDDQLVRAIYLPYLRELDEIKEELKAKYGFYPILYAHPALSNQEKSPRNPVSHYWERLKAEGLRFPIESIYFKIHSRLIRKWNSGKNVISF